MSSVQELEIEKKLVSLPKDIYDFILDPEQDDTANIYSAAGLALEQKRLIRNDIKRVYVGDLPVADFYATIKSKLGLPEDVLKKFVADFIGYRFLPIDDYLKGQASQALIAMGVSPSNYNVKMIVVRAAKPLDLVTEFLHEHPVNVPAHLEQRLRKFWNRASAACGRMPIRSRGWCMRKKSGAWSCRTRKRRRSLKRWRPRWPACQFRRTMSRSRRRSCRPRRLFRRMILGRKLLKKIRL